MIPSSTFSRRWVGWTQLRTSPPEPATRRTGVAGLDGRRAPLCWPFRVPLDESEGQSSSSLRRGRRRPRCSGCSSSLPWGFRAPRVHRSGRTGECLGGPGTKLRHSPTISPTRPSPGEPSRNGRSRRSSRTWAAVRTKHSDAGRSTTPDPIWSVARLWVSVHTDRTASRKPGTRIYRLAPTANGCRRQPGALA